MGYLEQAFTMRTRIYGSSPYLELALNLGNLGESDRAVCLH